MEMVIAALSCPDEKTAKLAYVAACQDVGRDLEDSLCGVVRIDDHTTINVHDRDGRDAKLSFKIGDFEDAEAQTKTRIHEGKTGGWADNFMRSVEFALEELTGKIAPAMHPLSTTGQASMTEEEVRAIVKSEVMPVIEHDVVDAISGIFASTTSKPVAFSQSASNVTNQIQAVVNINGVDSALRRAYREDTTEILAPAVAAIKENRVANTAAFEKFSTRLDETLHLTEQKFHTPEELPDFSNDGFFEPQKQFISRTGWSKRTLKKHRETKYNPVWLQDGTIGKSKVGHFFKMVGNKKNSSYEYFVYNDPEKTRRLLHKHKQ